MQGVIALAGRRIDAAGATTARFPLANAPLVRQRLQQTFLARNVAILVSSAACGADLLALEVAAEMGITSRIILPYAAERFRLTSVVDRPGSWGPIFDQVIGHGEKSGGLIVLDLPESDSKAFSAVNHAIIRHAMSRAEPDPARAILVWDGAPRGYQDLTDEFRRLASAAGMHCEAVLTLP